MNFIRSSFDGDVVKGVTASTTKTAARKHFLGLFDAAVNILDPMLLRAVPGSSQPTTEDDDHPANVYQLQQLNHAMKDVDQQDTDKENVP